MDADLQILNQLDDLMAASPEARTRATAALAARLGAGWSPEPPVQDEDALSLVHAPTGLRFVAVPGGRFEMGFSELDRGEATERMDWEGGAGDYVEELVESARPPHHVVVRPFLVARSLSAKGDRKLDVDRREALRFAESLGLRLPSEAEIEWIGRDGGELAFILEADAEPDPTRLVSRFGVTEFNAFQWAADDWHPSYEGAPAGSSPWLEGDPDGVYRSGFDLRGSQTDDDLALALAAVRYRGSADQPCRVRLARDIPDAL